MSPCVIPEAHDAYLRGKHYWDKGTSEDLKKSFDYFEQAIHEARALLAEQIGKFTLDRVQGAGKISFKASGEIDFFGEDVFTRVGGAGGRNWTERLPIRFEWRAAA